MSWYLGIEIGGTKLQLAIGRGEGEPPRAIWRAAVDASAGAARIQQQIETGAVELLGRARLTREQIAGVGIGFGGPVDAANGIVVTSHQVPGWDGFPLVAWVQSTLGWPARLHNDADSAAFAEARFGAGRGCDPVMYVTVGSGIGGGLVVGGAIFRGQGAGAMEIGHLRPGQLPLLVSLPAVSVEAVASGFGIEDRARRTIADWESATAAVEARLTGAAEVASGRTGGRRPPPGFATLLQLAGGDRSKITTRLIAQAAQQGDPLSRDLLADAAESLGWALGQAVALVNPARIVIGGGVSLMPAALFLDPVRRACRRNAFRPFAELADIVPASLGEEVVLYGALAVARDAANLPEPTLRAFREDDE